jgi:glycosyltransferase involved in cell wall biosynthesis
MRIAFIGVKGMPYGGGIEKVTEEIGSRLVARGHEVIVYCDKTYCRNGGYYKGMKLKPLGSLNHSLFRKVSNSLLAIFHLLINRHADIVHLHGVASLFAPIVKICSMRIVAHIHSFEWKKNKWNKFARFFLRFSDYFAVWFADRIVVVSNSLLKYFSARYRGKVSMLTNGVSRSEYVAPDLMKKYRLTRDNYILYIGRLSREKGVELIINAYNEINTRKVLVLAGGLTDQGPYRKSILSKIGANRRILQLGYVDGKMKAELMSNAYCVVFPGTIEGSPVALLEAMSYGSCCVISDIQEHSAILNGKGFMFRNRDITDLKDMLEHLLSHNNTVRACKKKAKKHSLEKYDWENIVDSYEALYSFLVDT